VTAGHLSPSFSATLRVHVPDSPGSFARLAQAIGDAGGLLGAIDIVRVEPGVKVRDVTVEATGAEHLERIAEAVRRLAGVEVEHVSDRTFLLHLGGKIGMHSKVPLRTRDDLSMAYTPGVARISTAIATDPANVWTLTSKQNAVAIVTDGTAVLGLGDIGPEAALPVMEGKAALFKEFADVDAWPLCLATTDVDEIVTTVTAVAPGFGGINLEDISAPRCFEIERRLRDELDIPVFHDDQHGTAIVVLAALINALRVVGKKIDEVKIVVSGVGAAGHAIIQLLQAQGAAHIVAVARAGAIHRGETYTDEHRTWIAQHTNEAGFSGTLHEALVGADVFIGVSGPNLFGAEEVGTMADGAIVLALANPDPEVHPTEAAQHAAVVATGRSDFPNQINNVLAFPGLFRGLLDAAASEITTPMLVAAAEAIADCVSADELNASYIVPSVFDARVAPAVAEAVRTSVSA
jgi:malate dehydrogenase (oxaloacetate-decarboxylating)